MAKRRQNLAHSTIELARKETQRIVAQEREKVFDTVLRAIVAGSTIVLHDEFGFGEKRLCKFVERMTEQFDCINFDTVTLEELEQLAEQLQGGKKNV